MKQKRIIIVEDDQDLLENMVKYLTLTGYEVMGVGSAGEFYAHITQQRYALAIIDIGLPDQNGLVLAEYVRKNTDMWVIILTACSTLDDKLAGLKSGADFYLVKPVDCSELAATIANLFVRLDVVPPLMAEEHQRGECVPDQAGGPWRLDRNGWIVITPKGDSIALTSKEYEFLVALGLRSKIIISRKEILKILDYPSTEQASHALESMICRLRKKIEALGCEFPVKTSHGVGYCLAANIIHI